MSQAGGIGPIVTGIPGRRSSVRVGCRPDTFIAGHSTIENSASIFVVTQLVIRIGRPKIIPTRSHHLAVHVPDVSSGIEARSRNEIDSIKVLIGDDRIPGFSDRRSYPGVVGGSLASIDEVLVSIRRIEIVSSKDR